MTTHSLRAADSPGSPGSQDPRRTSASRPWLDEPITVSRLVLRYAVTALVTLVVVAVVTAYVSRRLGTDEAIRDANSYTALAAGAAVEPALDDAILAEDPTAIAAVDRVVRTNLLKDPLVRVKIWTRDGDILYSDESRLIGDHFALGAVQIAAFDSGRSRAELSDLSEPENRFEAPATQLLEVYLPVRTTQGTELLFEAYYRYQGVAEQGRAIWLRFAPSTLGALLLLELLQVPLAVSLARRLRRTQTQREALLRQAIDSTDAERRRIASDLHDGVVQDLAGVAFSLGAVARRSRQGTPADTDEVRESADRVREALRSLRSLLVEIYPPNLLEEGIEAALSDLMASLEPRGIGTTLAVDARAATLDLDTCQLVYRAAQEGLRNVISHAGATRVDVRLTTTDAATTLEIVDDGRGLDDDQERGVTGLPMRDGHLGLKALAGVAGSVGATLSVRSAAGRGTILRLEVPRT
jgi:two-component system, NarL family, sensor kinase